MFPALRTEKLRARIVDGLHVRRLMQHKYFPLPMTTREKTLGGPSQPLSKASSEILRLSTITTF